MASSKVWYQNWMRGLVVQNLRIALSRVFISFEAFRLTLIKKDRQNGEHRKGGVFIEGAELRLVKLSTNHSSAPSINTQPFLCSPFSQSFSISVRQKALKEMNTLLKKIACMGKIIDVK